MLLVCISDRNTWCTLGKLHVLGIQTTVPSLVHGCETCLSHCKEMRTPEVRLNSREKKPQESTENYIMRGFHSTTRQQYYDMDWIYMTRFTNIIKHPNGSRLRHHRPAGNQLWRQDLNTAIPCVSGDKLLFWAKAACRVRPAVVRQLTTKQRNLNTTVIDTHIQESASC